MMLIGMALFKLGVLTLQRPIRLYVAMILLGYGIGLPVNISEVRWILAHDFSMLSYAESAITYDVGRIAMMTGHLGTLLLLYRSGIFPWLRKAFASVGQMALTNYLTHSLVCAILFHWLQAVRRACTGTSSIISGRRSSCPSSCSARSGSDITASGRWNGSGAR